MEKLYWLNDDIIRTTYLLPCFVVINFIQDSAGEGAKSLLPLLVFPLQLLQTYELSLHTFWLLVLTFFPHWHRISNPCLVPVPNYWTWTNTISQINWFLRRNPCKIEVMITSPIDMLEIPNFGHITTSTI